MIGPYEARACDWCGRADCDCDFLAVDECPPMCDCGGDTRDRPDVTVQPGWPVNPDTGLHDGPCGYIGCCSSPRAVEEET